jgi:hypothetical protein
VLKLVLVVAVFAAVTYATIRLLERRAGPGTGSTAPLHGPRARRPAPRPVAPDDDEDFLRWLDRKRRKDPPG